jgi:hypothetical protein
VRERRAAVPGNGLGGGLGWFVGHCDPDGIGSIQLAAAPGSFGLACG